MALGLVSACATASPTPQFVAIYRWQVKPGCETEFVAAWSAEAARYHVQYGSLGSRLHRDEDGTYLATAFWASAKAWSSAPRPLDLPASEEVLKRCIEAKLDERHLTVVGDVSGP